jgi:hypothetical protein
MKHLFLIFPLIALLAGCSAPGTDLQPVVTPERVESVARLSAYVAARAAVLKEPGLAEPLNRALVGLEDLAASEHWDLATAAAIATANGLGSLASEEGTFAVSAGVMFLDLVLGRRLDLAGDAYARAFILGTRDGLALALRSRNLPHDLTVRQRLHAEAVATR